MIGTNSIEESDAEILYPSISVCSERDAGGNSTLNVGQNISSIDWHLSLADLVLWLQLWQKNTSGELQLITIEPTDGKLENRDK